MRLKRSRAKLGFSSATVCSTDVALMEETKVVAKKTSAMKLTMPETVAWDMFQYSEPKASPSAPVPPMRASWYSGIRHEARAARRKQARSCGRKRARIRERSSAMLSPCSSCARATTAWSSARSLWYGCVCVVGIGVSMKMRPFEPNHTITRTFRAAGSRATR